MPPRHAAAPRRRRAARLIAAAAAVSLVAASAATRAGGPPKWEVSTTPVRHGTSSPVTYRPAIRQVAETVELPDGTALPDPADLLPFLSAVGDSVQRFAPGPGPGPGPGLPPQPAPASPAGQPVTPPPGTRPLPLGPAAEAPDVAVRRTGDRVSIVARNADVSVVLGLIAGEYGFNLVASESVAGTITVSLRDVPLEDALDVILATANATWINRHGILLVTPIANTVGPGAQGRTVRVFPLDYVAGLDVAIVVEGLLSPVGQSFVSEADPRDDRRTRETLVVEDLPEYLDRVARYLVQVDQPPRQVLVEAYVLQVDLESEKDHGVNWDFIGDVAGLNLDIQSTGFARGEGSPGLIVGLDTGSLDALVTALKTTRDAKTLASPKVLVVDGQEARIQVGGRFGYLTETTTQTSTVQNIEFLEVGVVLNVTPRIAADGQIMLNLKPEVSNGIVDPATGLPSEETTEVESTVLLRDGRAMVLGGLIQEEDSDRQRKLLGLGDLKHVGRLFGQRGRIKNRSEIIIAVLPRLVPYDCKTAAAEAVELDRIRTPIFNGPLYPAYRPWEPRLPDPVENPQEMHFPEPTSWLERGKPLPHAVPQRHRPVITDHPLGTPPPPGW